LVNFPLAQIQQPGALATPEKLRQRVILVTPSAASAALRLALERRGQ